MSQAPTETWSDTGLSRLVGLKPRLLKVFIDNKAHRSRDKLFRIFRSEMEGGKNENDIAARNLVQAWFDVACTSFPEDGARSETLSTSNERKGELRGWGFFHIQRSLAGKSRQALSFLNQCREQLGLSHVDSDHPSLVKPELSDEYRDLIRRSRRPDVKAGSTARKGIKKEVERKPQTSRHGQPTARNKKPAQHATHRPKPAVEKPPGSDQETEVWSDVPEEAPEPDWEGDPTEFKLRDEDTKPGTEVGASQPTPGADNKVGGSSSIRQISATRSSLRVAINKSLKLQRALSLPSTRKINPKKTKKRSFGVNGRTKSRVSSKPLDPEPGVLGASNPPFLAGELTTNKFKGREGDDVYDDIPPKDCSHFLQTTAANAMDSGLQGPLASHSSPYDNAWGSVDVKLPMGGEGLLAAPPHAHAPLSFQPPPCLSASSHLGALPPPHPPRISPPNESRPVTWDDSYLSQYGRIPVWAKSRQELCELPYFKSMQGGVYTRGGTVYGYLLGRFPSPRDSWSHEGRLIVSHGGGKNVVDEGETDPGKARHQLGDDQLESDKSVRALLTSYRMFRPVVILAEADYEHLREFDLKRGYAEGASYYVLGHYAIVAAWAEREEVVGHGLIHTRWKFAFQYIEGNQGPPWWPPLRGVYTTRPEYPCVEKSIPVMGRRRKFGGLVSGNRKRVSEVTTDSFAGTPSIECNECRTLSPQVYTLGPICLNPDCSSFWKHNGLPVPQAGLTFNLDFLALRGLPEQLQNIPYPIVPEYPDWQHRRNGESIFNRYYWAGACCHRCGRVSCRTKWECWECLTCGLRREESRPQIYDTSCLLGSMDCETQGGGIFSPRDMTSTMSRVVRYPDGLSRMVIYYELPGKIGRIIHILNNPKATQTADRLFQQYQQDASSMDMFQRHAMKTHTVKGELYAQHYSHNAGAPYKYIAEAISTPFENCPISVVEAKGHIEYLCGPALSEEVEFNEVLSIAYAEGQEMNFHSDDEPGLGPVIAGLTLGSHAEMLFRHHVAHKKNLLYKNGPFRPSEARASEDQDSNDRVLQITLSHGDLLIMHGGEIQKQYEHAVFVRDTDMVRFAATARVIKGPCPPVSTVAHDMNPGRHVQPESDHMQYNPPSEPHPNPLPLVTLPTQAEIPPINTRKPQSPSSDLTHYSYKDDGSYD